MGRRDTRQKTWADETQKEKKMGRRDARQKKMGRLDACQKNGETRRKTKNHW